MIWVFIVLGFIWLVLWCIISPVLKVISALIVEGISAFAGLFFVAGFCMCLGLAIILWVNREPKEEFAVPRIGGFPLMIFVGIDNARRNIAKWILNWRRRREAFSDIPSLTRLLMIYPGRSGAVWSTRILFWCVLVAVIAFGCWALPHERHLQMQAWAHIVAVAHQGASIQELQRMQRARSMEAERFASEVFNLMLLVAATRGIVEAFE